MPEPRLSEYLDAARDLVEKLDLAMGTIDEATLAAHVVCAAQDAPALELALSRLNRCVVEHHNIAHLSREAIAESIGGPCQICARLSTPAPPETTR